jgi:hypothetical protein
MPMRWWSSTMTPHDDDYILDIDSLGPQPPVAGRDVASGEPAGSSSFVHRPWLAVYWKCCHLYSRIYRNRAGDGYAGRCPGCGKGARARVGPGGVQSRFFVAH